MAGMALYAVFGSRMRSVSAATYVVMGLLVLFEIRPMKAALPPLSLALLIAGEAAYLVGFVFYALKKIKWMHSMWHLFVLAGSVLHFFSVYRSVS